MQADIAKILFAELGKMSAMVFLATLFLLVGLQPERVAHVLGLIVGIEPKGWDQPAPQAIQSKDPWLMTEQDLTGDRVVYNLTNKPGFKWLGVQLVVVLVGIGVVLKATRWVVVLAWRGVGRVREWRLPDMVKLGAELSGSVRITAEAGVIYMSGLSRAVADGMEEFGMYWRPVRVVVV